MVSVEQRGAIAASKWRKIEQRRTRLERELNVPLCAAFGVLLSSPIIAITTIITTTIIDHLFLEFYSLVVRRPYH